MLEREMELSKLHSTIASLNQEQEALRERINTQELSPDDVKRMLSERDQLQQAQEQASEARQVTRACPPSPTPTPIQKYLP